MNRTAFAVVALALVLPLALGSATGKVVNENVDDVPPGCERITGEASFTVRAGRAHAEAFPGAVFTFNERNFEVPACTRVTVTFVNEDDIRHQFMVHGTWPMGFFQLEVDGQGEDSGTFLTGAEPRTRLVHCGLPQHQQKGMKAQLLVDGGEGTLPNILGVSGLPEEDRPAAPGRDAVTEGDAPADARRVPALSPGALVLALAGVGVTVARRAR